MTVESRLTADLIKEAGKLDETVAVVRMRLVNSMKARNVPFKNIRGSILADLKEEGVYRKSYDSKTNKTYYKPFKHFLATKEKWAHDVRRTVQWINGEFSNYGVKRVAVEPTKAEVQAKELKKITNAWSVIHNLLCDTDNEAVKAHLDALNETIRSMTRE